jgi:hypothetical protein
MSNAVVRAIAITSTTLLVSLVGLMAWGWAHDDESPPSSIYSMKLECPVGTTEYTSLGNGSRANLRVARREAGLQGHLREWQTTRRLR